MENGVRQSGVRTIALRRDFFEVTDSGDWFGHHITAHSHLGQTMYPGPLDRVHAWACLPDMARAAVQVVARRADFEPFEEFVFGGYSITEKQLLDEIDKALLRPQGHN